MTATPRLGLPLIVVGQANKEITHNESIQVLDILVSGTIEQPPLAAPPSAPALGEAYIVAAAATGAWTGKTGCVAAWTEGGWRYISPREGMTMQERISGTATVYRGGAWESGIVRAESVQIGGQQVVGARSAAIATPSGGSVVDAEARAAVAAVLTALRSHGLIEA